MVDKPPVVVETPVDPPKKTAAGAYKRFVEIRSRFSKSGEKTEIDRVLRGVPAVIAIYLKGKAWISLGYYKDASNELKRIVWPIPDGYILNPVQERVVDEINTGRHWRLRMIAEAWAPFSDFDNRDQLDREWENKGKRNAQAVINDFEKAINAKPAGMNEAVARTQLRAMQNWLETGKDNWLRLWLARRTCQEKEEDINNWLTLINIAGPYNQRGPQRLLSNELCPSILDARAALLVLREFFPDDGRVKGGMSEVAVARTHIAVLQVDRALAVCPLKGNIDGVQRALYLDVKNEADSIKDEWIEDLKMQQG